MSRPQSLTIRPLPPSLGQLCYVRRSPTSAAGRSINLVASSAARGLDPRGYKLENDRKWGNGWLLLYFRLLHHCHLAFFTFIIHRIPVMFSRSVRVSTLPPQVFSRLALTHTRLEPSPLYRTDKQPSTSRSSGHPRFPASRSPQGRRTPRCRSRIGHRCRTIRCYCYRRWTWWIRCRHQGRSAGLQDCLC